MKSGQVLRYALKLNYGQVASEVNGSARQITKRDHTTKSAALLALVGLGMSGFSLKQMAAKSTRKF